MVNYASIQRHIDKGRGIAARHLGPPFAAYRCVTWSQGDFPDGWEMVNPSFPLFRRRYSEGKLHVGIKGMTIWDELIADMSQFWLGDVFLSRDPPYQAGVSYGDGATQLFGGLEFQGLCLAYHGPVNKSIGARVDRLAQIYRPNTVPVANPEGSLSWKSTLPGDQPLVLNAGAYAFGAPGSATASLVPVGLTSQHRKGDTNFKDVPGMVKLAMWFCYVPPIPGYFPREGDAIIDQNGTRYVVTSPWEQQAGVVGYQLTCDRKIGPPG
jgi:hypothetical protein